MRFQQFFDPYGMALQQAGQEVAIQAASLQNEIRRVDVEAAKAKLTGMREASAITAKAFQAAGQAQTAEAGPSDTLQGAGTSEAPIPKPAEPAANAFFRQYKFNMGMAEAAMKALNMAESEKYSAAATTALKDYETAKKDEFTQNEKRAADLSKMFAEGAQGPEQFGNAMRMMQYEHPEFDPRSLIKQFGFKQGPDGLPMFDANRARSLSGTMLTAKDRLEFAHKDEQQQLTQQLREIERRKAAAEERKATVAEAKARDGTHEKDTRRADAYVEKEKRSLHSEPVYKDFDKYEAAYDRALNVESSIKSKGGYANFTTSDAQALVNAGNQMSQGFRYRYAGTKEIELNNKLNGMIQNFEKTIKTIGTGEKRLAPDTVPEFIKTMKQIYEDRNEQVVKETMKRVQSVVKRGLDPDGLEAKGDVKALVEAGRAETVRDDKGNTYLTFKRPGGKKSEERYLIKRAEDE